MYTLMEYHQLVTICQRCPGWLRLTEACPRQPDFLYFPQSITQEDLHTAEQLAELRLLKITFTSFRENLLMNETMQPFVMNLILYSTYAYEVLMMATSYLAFMLPCGLLVGLLTTGKPGFCRALIVYLVAKTVFLMYNDSQMGLTDQRHYVCTLDGSLRENTGLTEQCFLVSVFFTYVVLSTLMSMNSDMTRNIITQMNISFYTMIGGAVFLLLLYLAKLHQQASSQTIIITSVELGMGFSIVFLIMMILLGLWPIRLSTYFDSLPEEELLLNYLCIKWEVNTRLDKLEKMTQIKHKLDVVLNAKTEFDKRAIELASKTQEDPLVYRQLVEDPSWERMQVLLDDMLNSSQDSKHLYFKL